MSTSTAKSLAIQAVTAAVSKNALQPVLLDVSAICSYADCVLILSGRSIRQVEAISDAIQQELKTYGQDPVGVEGERGGQWTLLDYGDVVIHVFYHPMRDFYNLESLWSDASSIELEVPPELRVAQMYI